MYERKIRYTTVSVSEELMNDIKKHISKYKRNISAGDFVREAVRQKINYEKPVKRMSGKVISNKELIQRDTERLMGRLSQVEAPIDNETIARVLEEVQSLLIQLTNQLNKPVKSKGSK